jgi:hypothetical protein
MSPFRFAAILLLWLNALPFLATCTNAYAIPGHSANTASPHAALRKRHDYALICGAQGANLQIRINVALSRMSYPRPGYHVR